MGWLKSTTLRGPKGDPGTNGTNGINGTNGRDGIDGVDGADGSNGLKGDKGDQGDQGNPGTNGTNGTNGADGASFTFPATVSGPGSSMQFANLTINETTENEDTSNWPNRWTTSFRRMVGGVLQAAALVSWFNEYGELRIIPAKSNTIPLRLFVKNSPTDPAHTVNMFEIVNDRTNRVVQFAVDSNGKVTAPNIGPLVVVSASPPTDTTAVWINLSA